MVADCYGYGYTTMDEGGPCSFHLGGPQQFLKYIQQHHLLLLSLLGEILFSQVVDIYIIWMICSIFIWDRKKKRKKKRGSSRRVV